MDPDGGNQGKEAEGPAGGGPGAQAGRCAALSQVLVFPVHTPDLLRAVQLLRFGSRGRGEGVLETSDLQAPMWACGGLRTHLRRRDDGRVCSEEHG